MYEDFWSRFNTANTKTERGGVLLYRFPKCRSWQSAKRSSNSSWLWEVQETGRLLFNSSTGRQKMLIVTAFNVTHINNPFPLVGDGWDEAGSRPQCVEGQSQKWDHADSGHSPDSRDATSGSVRGMVHKLQVIYNHMAISIGTPDHHTHMCTFFCQTNACL